VSLDDGAIYSRGKSKVIRVDDQASHRDSLAGRTDRRCDCAQSYLRVAADH
jgi:hypothetical protein